MTKNSGRFPLVMLGIYFAVFGIAALGLLALKAVFG